MVARLEDFDNKRHQSQCIISGEVISGEPAVVTIRQDRADDVLGAGSLVRSGGMTVTYLGKVVADGKVIGTFLDNRGGSGDWSLSKISDMLLKPVTAQLPKEEMFESVLGIYGRAIRGERSEFINLRPPHRDLWTDSIKSMIEPTIAYGDVDYIGTAKMIVREDGVYTIDLPGAGVELRVSEQLLESGDVQLARGIYEIEIYTNHWGQPYLTYADVRVFEKDSEEQLPFVNSKCEIDSFRSQQFNDLKVVVVTDYVPPEVEFHDRQ